MGMFQKTRVRLAAVNSLIMLVALVILGLMVYLYTEYRLYAQLDQSLIQIVHNEEREQFKDLLRKSPDENEEARRVFYLLWDQNQHLLKELPEQAFSPAETAQFKPFPNENGFRTLTVNTRSYRVLTVSGINCSLPESPGAKGVLQVMENIEPERNMLDSLFMVLLLGGLAGIGISLLAGYFLAQRALIPIKKSWHKQQAFVADASHELRTPLTVIQANLELLFRHPQHTIETESVKINTALNEAKRMIKLVGEMLTLARSGSGEPEFSFQQFDFGQMVHEVAGQFQWLAQAKNIELKVDVAEKIMAMGDPDRLRQLLIILLDNAVKYTPASGQINVECRSHKQRVEVVVEDTGIGIPEVDLPHIFDRFYRSDKSRARAESGAGLGLSIAQWIVEGHSGVIRVESKPGKGTKFQVQVPLKQKILDRKRASQ